MGTAAVFMIRGYNDAYGPDRKNNGEVIGMTSDGFPSNLTIIAEKCFIEARRLRALGKFRSGDRATVEKVLNAVVNNSRDNWLFLSDSREPQWVSYSAVLDPTTGKLEHYEGYHTHELIKTELITPVGR